LIKRFTIFACLFLTLFTSTVFFKIFYSPKNPHETQEWLTKTTSNPKYQENFFNKQIRSGVSKDLWILEKGKQRLHHHVESPYSILTATPNANRIELVEQMLDMKCYFQEKIEEEKKHLIQNIRYFESKEGLYHYTNHSFTADSVFLRLHRIPGDILTTNLDLNEPYLKGLAENITLSFSEKLPRFHAEKFKAQVWAQEK